MQPVEPAQRPRAHGGDLRLFQYAAVAQHLVKARAAQLEEQPGAILVMEAADHSDDRRVRSRLLLQRHFPQHDRCLRRLVRHDLGCDSDLNSSLADAGLENAPVNHTVRALADAVVHDQRVEVVGLRHYVRFEHGAPRQRPRGSKARTSFWEEAKRGAFP
jgi:hypothetical protein